MISVIMGVYNEPKEWLIEAIESILNQTYKNFEFIIILDKPDNELLKTIINDYAKKDKRIKFYINEKNIGLTNTLNKALKYSKGEYIARMDADDISLKNRFEIQINYMKKNKVDILGTNIIEFNDYYTKKSNFCLSYEDIKNHILNYNQLAHPTMMFKKEVLLELKYRNIYACEDYDMILRAIKKGYKINNIKEHLLKYRINNNSISRKNLLIQKTISLYLSKKFDRLEHITEEEILKLKNKTNQKKEKNYYKASLLLQDYHSTSNKLKKIFLIMQMTIISPLFFKLVIYQKSKKLFLNNLNKIKKKTQLIINCFIKKIKKFIKYLFAQFFSLFPIKKNKVLFVNFLGKGIGDSPKYIINELKNSNIEIIFVSNKKLKNIPNNVKTIRMKGIKYFYHLYTSKIWVDNCRKSNIFIKRKSQIYIQTWHGGIPLKKIEGDAIDKIDKEYIDNAKRDTKMTDIMISNSSFCTEIYRRAFWFEGIIKEYGTPRNDILLNEKKQKKIKNIVLNNLRLDNDCKILLYAPTFRNSSSLDYYKLDFDNLLEYLNNKTKEKWKILIRLHPNISNKSKELYNYSDDIINVTDYDDMYELMTTSDVLITDYSSVMFEFSFMKKPVFLYANDINEYIDERGFYFDYFRLPYSVSKDYDELINNINNFDVKKYKSKIEKFYNQIGLKETGKAAKLVANDIIKIIEGDKIEK